MYKYYREKYPDSNLSRKEYKEILRDYNNEVITELLKGKEIKMFPYLGSLQVLRIERGYTNLAINWKETHKLRKSGINKNVYYTDSEYIRVRWYKSKARTANKSYYSFKPARGNTGLKSIVSKYLVNNPDRKHDFELVLRKT
tara:strand:+ start:1313 stop:1738 length:426 start_codon:yes stop_codon:yes gene_type:complete